MSILHTEHDIAAQVYAAKESSFKADELIRYYIPYIKSEASKTTHRQVTDKDDEYSIAMMAFYEAIKSYDKQRGSFLKYAAMLIKSRIYDYNRRELRHSGNISLYEESDTDRTLAEELHDTKDRYTESENLEATKAEIAELSAVMADFGITFADVAENSPKQDRTLAACAKVIRYAAQNKPVLEELLRTKKLPLNKLIEGTDSDRKTLERHRKYLLAMLLIQTNGYEIIRGHLVHILKGKEATV